MKFRVLLSNLKKQLDEVAGIAPAEVADAETAVAADVELVEAADVHLADFVIQ